MSSMKKTKEGINLKKLLRLKNTGSIFVIAGLLIILVIASYTYILQISFSSYPISLSFNQSSDTKIRSISISSPCHFYFVLYCFI